MGLVFGGIGGLLQNVESFEVLPELVRWIGETSGSECIRGQQVAEFVVNRGLRNMQPRQQGDPKSKRQEEDEPAGEHAFVCKPHVLA